MKSKFKKNLPIAGTGFAIGLVNGLFGAGGGMLAVPLLKKIGLDQKSAHKNAVAVILPVSILSAVIYLVKDYVKLSDALPFIPAGVAGALIGAFAIKKIPSVWLKRIFGGFMVYAGVRLLFK